jgi:hypothetical protein
MNLTMFLMMDTHHYINIRVPTWIIVIVTILLITTFGGLNLTAASVAIYYSGRYYSIYGPYYYRKYGLYFVYGLVMFTASPYLATLGAITLYLVENY